MMSRIAYSKLMRFLAARLSPGGELGLHLTMGVAMLVVAVAAFGEIAEAVGEGTISPVTTSASRSGSTSMRSSR
ncbi:hypothetical protein [Pseudoduganella armeniaca]|uniref:hypothetical protein n=1 Tax=Pseudoduganella armeniaca TaxID=2072590 RepID=UPI001E53D2A7|nr:hypothetical protein [Pseudoduganella armeniaca]